MKYIVDVPDEHTDIKVFYTDADMKIIQSMRCEPYTELDKEPTMNEAWDFVKALYGLSDEELYEIFPNGCPYEMTYSEAKAKYEEWKKQKDDIHVVDEVICEVCTDLEDGVICEVYTDEKGVALLKYQPKYFIPNC